MLGGMQCAPGGCADLWAAELRGKVGKMYALKLSHVGGRSDDKNLRVLSLARSDRGIQESPEIVANGSTEAIPVNQALPWDFIVGQFNRDALERAFRKTAE